MSKPFGPVIIWSEWHLDSDSCYSSVVFTKIVNGFRNNYCGKQRNKMNWNPVCRSIRYNGRSEWFWDPQLHKNLSLRVFLSRSKVPTDLAKPRWNLYQNNEIWKAWRQKKRWIFPVRHLRGQTLEDADIRKQKRKVLFQYLNNPHKIGLINSNFAESMKPQMTWIL